MGYAKTDLVDVSRFTRQQEGGETVIGLPSVNVFLALPSAALEILDNLSSGKTVGEAQAEFARAHGIEPDIDDLLQCLQQRGFVRPRGNVGDDRLLNPGGSGLTTKGVRYHFSSLPQAVARRFFGPLPLALYFTVIALALVVAFARPSLLPHRSDLVFTEHRTAKLLALSSIVYITLFLHEFAHLLATKAQGINARIGVSNRLWALVAETDMTGLWRVPSRQRYLPMLAGPLLDSFSAALLLLLLFAGSMDGLAIVPPVEQFCKAMIFTYLFRLLWQCAFFVRTDLYYVIANLFHCKNLMKDTEIFIKNSIRGAIGLQNLADQSHIPLRERRVIRYYSVLWVAGRGMAFFSLFYITLPILFRYLRNALRVLQRGYADHHYQYLDSLVVGALNLLPLVIGLLLWITSIVRERRTT